MSSQIAIPAIEAIDGSQQKQLRSRRYLRSAWVGMLLGLMPFSSGMFWLALLIPAFVQTRLVIVVSFAVAAYYCQGFLDPIVEPFGQYLLTHAYLDDVFAELAKVRLLHHLHWHNSVVISYLSLFLLGVPVIAALKWLILTPIAAIVRVLAAEPSINLSADQLPPSLHDDVPIAAKVDQVSSRSLAQSQDQKRDSHEISTSESEVKPNPAVVENSQPAQPLVMIRDSVSRSESSKKSKGKSHSVKSKKKDRQKNKSKSATGDYVPITNSLNTAIANVEKLLVIHHPHQPQGQMVPKLDAPAITNQEPAMLDRVWEESAFIGEANETDLLNAVLDIVPTTSGPTTSSPINQTADGAISNEPKSPILTASKKQSRKKLTVKETIIDIIRWKKTDNQTMNAVDSLQDSSLLAVSSETAANTANQVQATGRDENNGVNSNSPIAAMTVPLTSEPLPFLLGYLSNLKRADKPGGR